MVVGAGGVKCASTNVELAEPVPQESISEAATHFER